MKKLIVLLLLFGCVEEKIVIYKNCFDMTIPQGNPVKFWLNGVETFNEKVVPGVMQVCFCGRWKTTDTIKVQVVETVYTALTLKIWNSDDEEVGSVDFTETSNIFNVSFTLAGEGVTDSHVYFTIVVSSPTMEALSTWTNQGTGDIWATGANPSVTVAMGDQSRNLHGDFLSYSGQTYRFTVSADIDVDFTGTTLSVTLYDASYNPVGSTNIDLDPGDFDGTVDVLATGDGIYVGIRVNNLDLISDVVVDIDSLTYSGTNEIQLAESDCFNIDDEDDESFLIQYSNESNFAGLDYSAETIFGVRVESSFFKERFPEEDESEEISDGSVVKLSGSVKNQRLLQIEPAPFYFHNLLKRVLQHNTIYIDGLYWEKEEAYEITEINQRQPLQKGQVWLTQKEDGYDTNVYGTLTSI